MGNDKTTVFAVVLNLVSNDMGRSEGECKNHYCGIFRGFQKAAFCGKMQLLSWTQRTE